MAFRNSLLLIAFFLVATTSVANCTTLPVSNLLPATVIVEANLINITAGVGVITPLAGANVSLICNGVRIGQPTVVPRNGVLAITVPLPNATLIDPSCILSANVSIGGVVYTATSTLFSLTEPVPLVVGNLIKLLFGVLNAVLVDGTFIKVRV